MPDTSESETMSQIQMRAFTENDIGAVLELWTESDGLGSGPGDTVEGITRFLRRNPELSLVACDGARVVGALLCGHDGRRGFIYRLAVASSHRRRGLAREMAQRCLLHLQSEGIPRCLVFVLTDNEAAKHFWQSLGGEVRSELQMLSIPVSANEGHHHEHH